MNLYVSLPPLLFWRHTKAVNFSAFLAFSGNVKLMRKYHTRPFEEWIRMLLLTIIPDMYIYKKSISLVWVNSLCLKVHLTKDRLTFKEGTIPIRIDNSMFADKVIHYFNKRLYVVENWFELLGISSVNKGTEKNLGKTSDGKGIWVWFNCETLLLLSLSLYQKWDGLIELQTRLWFIQPSQEKIHALPLSEKGENGDLSLHLLS